MSIYKKIRESKRTALKKTETQSVMGNAFEAVAAGGRVVSDQEKSKDKESGGSGGNGIGQIVKMAGMVAGGGASPITYKSSALKRIGNGEPKVEKKIVNYKGTAHDYIRTNVDKPGVIDVSVPDAVGGGEAGPPWEETMKKLYQDGASIQQLVDKGHGTTEGLTNLFKGLKQGSNVPPSKSSNVTLTPRTVEEKTDPSQQYNMSFKNVENANWAKGSMRRGLNRDERKDIKNTVQKMRTLDPKATEKYKESMKKSREGSFLGLGIGGDRQERKIKALKDAGILDENYQSIKSEIADTNLQMGTEERKQKIESATMNKYNMGLNEFGDKKPGSSKTVAESGEGYEEYDGPVGDFTPNSASNIDFSKYGMKDYAGEFKANTDELLKGFSAFDGSAFSKKGKLGKNAKAFKNKAGRGAGY